MKLVIVNHPGYADRVKAKLIPGLHNITTAADVEPKTLVVLGKDDVVAVKSEHVFTPEGLRYAEEWSTKTGRSLLDVYIPKALEVSPPLVW